MQEQDAEDFAQECAIKSFEKKLVVNFEYIYLNFRDSFRADKRILSSPQGQLSAFRTISTSTPIDSSNPDSSELGDFIRDQRDLPRESEERSEMLNLIESILKLSKSPETRKWATEIYIEWLKENVF